MHNSDDSAIALLVSIGTGESYVRRFARAGGFSELFQALRAARVLATDTHKVDELLRTITQRHPDSYFRFNADDRLGKIKLDCWKTVSEKRAKRFPSRCKSTADEIRRITEEYLDKPEVVAELNRVAEILVRNRQMRSRTDRWEERLLGLKWRCLVEGCPEGPLARRRVEFEDHLQNFHAFGLPGEQAPAVRSEYNDLIARGRHVVE